MHSPHLIPYSIEERSYASVIKRDINRSLKESGYSQQKVGEVDIILSEITSNLMKHTHHGGKLLYRVNEDDSGAFFEMYCIDNGPGTNEMPRYMKDGISSSNTLGQGLGAINRLSDQFQIYSTINWGTVLYTRKNLGEKPRYRVKHTPLQIQVVQQPIPGETVCGDGYWVKHLPHATHLFVGDGLGHGPNALEATQKAIEAFRHCEECNPADVIRYMHDKVKKTRGLVGTVIVLDHTKKLWKIAGVGNIATRLYKGLEFRNFMPYNGIIGLNIPNKISDYEMAAESYQTLVMTSDGIRNKWDLGTYPALLKYNAGIIAASIFKDHARHSDDMTVLVAKLNF
jgi:anti-sigma regulatory factor (Ser/Thr protein kinase)